jgi:hypothetical protein
MEDIAYFVSALLMFMLLFSVSTIVLAILAKLNKVPKAVGYVAVGAQAVMTVFAFLITTNLGLIAGAITGICLLLVVIDGGSKK